MRADGEARLRQSLPVAGAELLRLEPGDSVRAAAAEFEREPEVLYAEPNFYYELQEIPNDSRFLELWGLHNTGQFVNGIPDADIDAPEAWETTTGSTSVKVAVVDTGIAYHHPDLASNIWTNPGEIAGNGVDDDVNGRIDDVRGWDFLDNDNSPLDLDGHGTHVAGTIAAHGNNGQGVAGVNWRAALMPLRVCPAAGGCSSVGIVNAFAYAGRKGARVVNASFGSPNFSQILLDVIKGWPGTLYVAAAGNDGLNLDAPGVDAYPCEYAADNMICVAATDHRDAVPTFSNYGATAVDLGAPGVSILSTLAAPDTVFSETFEGDIGATWTFGGTNNTWARTNERAKSGSFSLTDSPGGNYANDTDSFARLTNAFSLAGRTDCALDYELRLATQAGGDGFVIDASTNAIDWTGLQAWTGTSGGAFVPLEESLNVLNGQASAYLRFRMLSDSSVTDDGVHLDDLRVLCPAVTYDAGDFDFLHGTSMAAPHVSGAAALMWADTPGVSVAEIRQRMLGNVDALPSLTGRTVTGGRLNVAKAVESAPPPVVATQPATAITHSTATLNGTVNPRGHATSYRFEYGTTTSYGQSTPVQSAGAGDGAVAVSVPVTGLEPNTTYHYRLVATYSDGPVTGADAQFTTQAFQPVVTAQPATSVTTSTAILNGTVDPSGASTTYHFEYGLTTAYENSTPVADAGAGNQPVAVSAPLTLLEAGTTYHFRLVATNAGGTTSSADAEFTTAPLGPPLAALAAPTAVLRTSVTLNGTVDPAGKPTLYRFQYGTTTAYGSSIAGDAGDGIGPVAVSASLTDLTPGTIYHFRLVAQNPDGTAVTGDGQFTTAAVGPPVVATEAATPAKRSAVLEGVVNPQGLDTTYHWEYGLTTSYGTLTPTANAAAAGGAVAADAELTGLTPGTTYHYRLVATSADGTTESPDAEFTTLPPTPPLVAPAAATNVAKRGATLNGTVDPQGLGTTYRFEYGTTTSYGTFTPTANAAAGNGAVAVDAPVTGLAPGTTYHFRLVATSADGTTSSADAQFTTAAPTPPLLTLRPTTAITTTGATVSGTVNPRGVATTYHFQYGTSTSYGKTTLQASAGSGTGQLAVARALSGLAHATTYHYRLVAVSADGVTRSADGTFRTRARPPQASTGAAAAISQTGATVGATVNPNGQPTVYAFQYGRSTAYGARTPNQSAGAGRAAVAVRAALSGLEPGTAYHYRVVATNATGTVVGADRVLTTAPPPPITIAPATLRPDRRGVVTVRLTFPATTPAGTGRAEIFSGRLLAATSQFSPAPAFAGLSQAPKLIGAKSFATRPDGTARVRIRLTRAGRRLVARRASVTATVRVTVLTQVQTKQVRIKRRRG